MSKKEEKKVEDSSLGKHIVWAPNGARLNPTNLNNETPSVKYEKDCFIFDEQAKNKVIYNKK
jgi:hypothetical protein